MLIYIGPLHHSWWSGETCLSTSGTPTCHQCYLPTGSITALRGSLLTPLLGAEHFSGQTRCKLTFPSTVSTVWWGWAWHGERGWVGLQNSQWSSSYTDCFQNSQFLRVISSVWSNISTCDWCGNPKPNIAAHLRANIKAVRTVEVRAEVSLACWATVRVSRTTARVKKNLGRCVVHQRCDSVCIGA